MIQVKCQPGGSTMATWSVSVAWQLLIDCCLSTLLGRLAGVGAQLGLDDLMKELRVRRWTLYRWGQEDDPALLVGQFHWTDVIDAVILRPDGLGCSYRCPAGVPDSFRPDAVAFQWAGDGLWALRRVLALESPGHPQAPTRLLAPLPECAIPMNLPKPFVMRPLSRVSLSAGRPARV